MVSLKIIKQLKLEIANDKLPLVIESLLGMKDNLTKELDNNDIGNDIVFLSNSFKRLNKAKSQGLIEYESAETALRNIVKNAIAILDEILKGIKSLKPQE